MSSMCCSACGHKWFRLKMIYSPGKFYSKNVGFWNISHLMLLFKHTVAYYEADDSIYGKSRIVGYSKLIVNIRAYQLSINQNVKCV